VSEYIRIGTIPRISEDTDRWGMPLGTYRVHSAIGYVTREKWQELYEFENHDACGGKEETEKAAEQMRAGRTIDELDLPLMRKRVKRQLIEEFNATKNDPSTLVETDGIMENEYVRMVAFFNHRTLVEWKSEHDEMLRRAQEECDRLNRSTGDSSEHA
jgi:hypothetical protein